MFTSKYTIYKVVRRVNTRLNHFYNNIEPHYKLLFVMAGKCSVMIQRRQTSIEPGCGVLIPPYVIHSAVFSGVCSIELIEVQFDFNQTTDAWMLNSRLASSYCFKIQDFETFQILIRSAFGRYRKAADSEAVCDVTYLIDKTLFQLFDSSSQDLPHIQLKDDSPYRIIEEMFDLLNTDLQNNNSIATLCQNLHVSNSYLYQCTRKILKSSPQDLLIQYKINKAYKLLEDKSLTIEKIAGLLSYKNAFYFSKQFKDIAGISPSKFRAMVFDPVQ